MTLQQVVDMAVNGELKSIAAKDDVAGIVQYINLGMIELYKRFPLKMEEHIVALQTGVETYKMPSDFMWIAAAYGEIPIDDQDTIVTQLPVNEEDNPLSVNTVSWNTLQVPQSVTGSYISIMYVAAPKYLTTSDLSKDIELPPQMIEALLHYVGYRAHASMNGNIQAENNTHYTRFEQSCKRIEDRGMFNTDDLDMTDRYSKMLWV